MSERTFYERAVEIGGFKYIKLKSGRLLSYWEARKLADAAHSDLVRAMSRCFKLAPDYELESIGYEIGKLAAYVTALNEHLEKLQSAQSQKERIAALRNVDGRTPEEAAAFLSKAEELERKLEEA